MKHFLGLDIGGTKIAGALVTNQGKILRRVKIATPPGGGSARLLVAVEETVRALLPEGAKTPTIAGIGIGVPGLVGPDRGTILHAPNLRVKNCRLAAPLARRHRVPVVADNDVNLGVLGEQWLGAARGAQNVVGLFPGTGVGGGIIIRGELYSGHHGGGGELGHLTLVADGPPCTCGNRGCLEAFASRWAIEKKLRLALSQGKRSVLRQLLEGHRGPIKSGMIRKALKRKDPLVTRVMKEAGRALGQACASLRHVLDPELIIFGGGLIDACGDFLLPIIRQTAANDPYFASLPPCPIVPSRLGDDAVLLGAVALVRRASVRKPSRPERKQK